MKNKLKTLIKVSKQRSAKMRFPIVFRGQTATATNDTTELTLRLPIVWTGNEPSDGVKIDADNVSKIAKCIDDADELRIEVSDDYATINGVRVMIDGSPAGGIELSDETRTELEVTEELRTAVTEVRACVADDPLRLVMNGVYIDSTMVAATDAYVLAWRDVATGLPEGVKAVIYPDMFDFLPEGCRTIQIGDHYNIAESNAGRVVSKRPDSERPYPNVRAVIPEKHDGVVTLDGDAVRDAFRQAKNRKLVAAALVVRDGAAGMEFYENIAEAEGDIMRVSLPCRVKRGSWDAVVALKVELLERVLGKSKHNTITIEYRDSRCAVVVNGCSLVMPVLDKFDHGKDFTPDRIELPEREPETATSKPGTPDKQRIVELPDGAFVVIGGRKPKGGRAVKAWIVNSIEI